MFRGDKTGVSRTRQRFWIFYAGPENYLNEYGERDFLGEMLWSCEPETRAGDLALLYRKSINHLSTGTLMRKFSMTREAAEDVKRREIGKDISAVWKVTSGNLGPFSPWPASCCVRQLRRLDPPLKFDELKKVRALWGWDGFRSNLRASGRGALEIPPYAWEVLKGIIETKYGFTMGEER